MNKIKNENNYILPFLWMKGESQEIILEEMEKILECGIKAVCIESRPHPDFLGERWWQDLDIIVDFAKKNDMRIWILDDAHFPTGYANNLITEKYPERKKKYINFNTVDIWGKNCEVTIPAMKMRKPLKSFLDVHIPYDMERENNRIVSVVAYPIIEGEVIDSKKPVKLTEKIDAEGNITFRFPVGNFRVFVFYETKTDGGRPDYINVIDRESVSTLIEAVYEPHYKHFKEDFGKVIAGFFSDEPGFGNCNGFSMDDVLGKKCSLPWSNDLPEIMEEKLGKNWRDSLALLWFESMDSDHKAKVRYAYMDAVTDLYRKNFSFQLGKWCEEHKVEYIGHVIEDNNEHARLGCGAGHYFRAMAGQHMAGIDIISDQIIFGGGHLTGGGIFKRDGEFNHFALCKLGVSSAYFDKNKKGRTMCEIFGAFGWKFGVRDMKYVLDEAIFSGVNHFVPHAFSMTEYPDRDCPPHFYAGGHFPQFGHFKELMKYTNRMCDIISGGEIVPDVAILYHGESEWTGETMLMQKPARKLSENQIDYMFIPSDYIMDHGDKFKAIIIPDAEYLTKEVIEYIKNTSPDRIYFIRRLPKNIKGFEPVSLEELPEEIYRRGHFKIKLENRFSDLKYLNYKKDGKDCYMFLNQSTHEAFKDRVSMPFNNGAVYYDGLNESYSSLKIIEEGKEKYIELEIPVYGSCVIFDEDSEDITHEEKFIISEKVDLSNEWEMTLILHGKDAKVIYHGQEKELLPVSERFPKFSGIIQYEKEIDIDFENKAAYLEFEKVGETLDIWANDEYAGFLITPPYRINIGKLLKKGENCIKVRVYTTLDRDQLNYPEPMANLNFEVMEATGLYGRVTLEY